MRLDWSKEAIEEYLDTCLKKKKLTDYDYAIINFYDDYLDFHKMKGIYDKQFKDKSKILKKTTIKDILKEIENLVDDYRYLLQVLPKGVSFDNLNQKRYHESHIDNQPNHQDYYPYNC